MSTLLVGELEQRRSVSQLAHEGADRAGGRTPL
jgi:hypothetical protein